MKVKIRVMIVCLSMIENGFIYRIKTDEEAGTVRIVRYRVKNWDQIKTTIKTAL